MIDTKRVMVKALNETNADLMKSQIKTKSAKQRILNDFSGIAKNETFKGEAGTDAIATLLVESLYAFKATKNTNTISFLTSKIHNTLESEVAWARLNNLPAFRTEKDRAYLLKYVNKINDAQAKNLKLSAGTKLSIIRTLTNLDHKKMSSRSPLRSVLAPKFWKKFASGISKDVSAIRDILFNTLQTFAENHPNYKYEKDVTGTHNIIKIADLERVVENYMFKKPLPITDVHAGNFQLVDSIHKQSIKVALQSSYTFNEDYNAAIEAIIESCKHVKYFDAENQEALYAKVLSVETDVENGLRFWNEIGKGNVYFNYVIDFRGRISQLGGLSAVGHKVGKAMLRAGVKKALGTTGLKHLLIALGSSMGHDKMTFTDREEWAHDNMDTYVEIGEMLISNPVKAFETLYELDADDIFDAAAISLELYYISEFDGQIEDYKSNLFIGLDATCSGLQLVSLLWGNKMLAENTNVAKFDSTEDRIYDIYKYLYEAMDEVTLDFDPVTKNTPDGEEMVTIWGNLTPKVKRSIAKKLLMPRIYGSTFKTWSENTRKVAGKKKIFNHIQDLEKRESSIFQFGLMVARLFKATFDKEEGFQAFRDFDNVVGQVAKAYNDKAKDTAWTINEPSTFENQFITAKYRILKTSRYMVFRNGVKTFATAYNVSIFEDELQKVSKVNKKRKNTRKAKNAISPNFVHALDALLLHTVNYSMKTAMRLTHDCFACTPGEVERMIEIINHAYIDLFGGKNNIIVKLAAETLANTGTEIIIPDTLNSDGINLDCIKKGVYKFS